MPKYITTLTRKARKQLDKLPDDKAQPIFNSITGLETNPRPHGYIKLKDKDGYRIRVGDYRVIYEIHDEILVVDVIEVGHRIEVYY